MPTTTGEIAGAVYRLDYTMSSKIYPYRNLSLSDIKEETWDDVPGYEGEYQVSNLGRVKSLLRWRSSGLGGGYYTKELIRKSIMSVNINDYTGEKNYLVSISLKKHGIRHTTAIARYVYYAFVEPFEIDNPDIIVSYKDYDGRNVRPANLFLTTRHGLVNRSFQLGRTYSQGMENKTPV